MLNEVIPANSAVVFPVTLEIDGEPWDLTGATVTLLLRKGATASSQAEYPATVTSAAAGEAEAELSASDMAMTWTSREWERTTNSQWEGQWKVVQSGDTILSDPIPFTVVV